jgi:endonuclease/exonuclease/phosphatase family metal-dependent hydrolase
VVLEEIKEEVPMNTSLTAMSFNIYYTSLTKQRKESVKQTILNAFPDTLGVQEATKEWMSYLNSALGGVYDSVGLGRDGGSNGEHSAIFYKRDRFELIETGTKWMSATPDEVSKFEESSLNRVFTYAILREKKTNNELLVVNTHLDHTSSRARELQAGVLMDFLKNYGEYPIVLTGDFNTMPGSNAYRTVTSQLADSSKVAETAEEHGTYGSSVIDYAFVSKENIRVSEYRVITEEANGMQPSDHYPLIIEYTLLP